MSALGTRKLKVSIDGTDYTAEVSKCVITSGESDADFVSFADAAAGGARDYKLNIIGVQDGATGSFWDKIWTKVGQDVPIVVMPYGNAAPTPAQPHWTATAVVTEPDGDFLGGEADASNTARMTVEVAWPLTSKPVRKTA